MSSLYHRLGAGDFFQAESFMTDAERAAVDTIYWATPAEPWTRPVLEACDTWKHVKHVSLHRHEIPEGDQVRSQTSRYHAVLHRRPYTGSSLLKQNLCDLAVALPKEFAFVQFQTPANSPIVRWMRDAKPVEWGPLLETLKAWGLPGVVVNASGADRPPADPSLIDLTGQTSIVQGIEILKRASGYAGIDSCFAILASQRFAADRLLIRTGNSWVVQNRWTHYAPHDLHPFLVPEFGAAPYSVRPRPPIDPELKLIELKADVLIGNRNCTAGDFVEVAPHRADAMFAAGTAMPAELPPVDYLAIRSAAQARN